MRPHIPNLHRVPPRDSLLSGRSLSLGISDSVIRNSLSAGPVAISVLEFPFESIAIVSDPTEHLEILRDVSSMKRGLESYCSCIVNGDHAGMARAATQEIIPKMRSVNIIDQKLLERNGQMIGIAATVLSEIRVVQAELLKGVREQIEEALKIPNDKTAEMGLSDIAGAVLIAAQTVEQAAITDFNELTISRDMWRQIWEMAPEGQAGRYVDAKKQISEDSDRIAALCAELETILYSPANESTGAGFVVKSSQSFEPKKMNSGASTSADGPSVMIKDRSSYLLLKILYQFVDRQAEARRKAAVKRQEELAEEERLREKKLKAKLAERKRAEKSLAEKLTIMRAFILEAIQKLCAAYVTSQQQFGGDSFGELHRAGRDKLYFEQMAKKVARQANIPAI